MRGKGFEFSEEQIDYIISHWGKESPYSMKKKFGCTWYAVCKVAKENGLEIPTSNEWTEEEIEMLKLLADQYHYSDIATIMNKSENAIYLKAKKLKIVLIQDRRKWTKEEEQLLSDLWGVQSIESLAKKLKRTVFSLKVKAVRMGLGPMIRNNYEVITISDVSDLLSISRDRILNTWVKLGLKVRKKRLTKKKSYFVVVWEDLMKFLEQNQNEWDSRKLEKYMLGVEPDWLIKKRKRDLLENPLWYRRWAEEEIQEVESLFKIGKDYLEIAKRVNRSEWATANLLRIMGYSYMLPQFWKGAEIKYIRENYENMTYSEIAEVLGRTVKAVAAKTNELGYHKQDESKDIRKMVDSFTLEEIRNYLIAWREEKNEEAFVLLVNCNTDFIEYTAKELLEDNMDLDDLISAGKEGFINAINTFEYSIYTIKKFITYSENAIRKSILKEIKDYTKHNHVLHFEQSIDYNQEGEEIKIVDLVNSLVGKDEEDIIREVVYHMEVELVPKILQCLTPEEKQLVSMQYGLFGIDRKTQMEIAEVFDCSKSTIASREKKVLVKIKSQRGIRNFKKIIEE